MTKQHLALLQEAVDLHDRFPDLADIDVIETVCDITQTQHNYTEHAVAGCMLCKSIIVAYDNGYEAGRKHYTVYYG